MKSDLFGTVIDGGELEGYEIHLGRTEYREGATPVFALRREGQSEEICDGVASPDGLTIGTYLHGLFDSDRFRHAFISAARAASGLTSPSELVFFSAERESRFDRLATCVREAMDVEAVLGWLELGR
jgi:adenosylcobyric acid synthase